MEIVLASKSPRRKELLKKIVNDFIIDVSSKDEVVPFYISKNNYSLYLSKVKAKDVFKRHPNSLVIGADTIVLAPNNEILEKPKDKEDVRRMMNLLSNNTHQVITGVTIISKGYKKSFKSITNVTFRKIEDNELEEYLKLDTIYDKAGAYAIQAEAGKFVTLVEGEYDNVVGLPTIALSKYLKEK